MRAKKSNKSYSIEASEAKKFQTQGYDIYDDDGNLIAFGAGKMIPAEAYLTLLKEKMELEKLLEENSSKGVMKEAKKEKEVKEEVE